jgi:hypothetical protein
MRNLRSKVVGRRSSVSGLAGAGLRAPADVLAFRLTTDDRRPTTDDRRPTTDDRP